MSRMSAWWSRLTTSEAARAAITTDAMGSLLAGFTTVEQEQQAKLANYIRTSNAVYACSRARAQRMASVPLRLYRGTGEKRKEVTSGKLYDLLHKVNPYWTFNRLIDVSEQSMCIAGEAFWFIDGRREIWWAPSDKVRVVTDPKNYISHFEYTPDSMSQPIKYRRDETIWFRYPNPLDALMPLAPLTAAALAADTSIAAMKSNLALFRNGNQMGGYIGPRPGSSFTEEQATALETGLSRRFSGADKRHKWAVFRYELDVKPLGVSPKDAEFLESLKWSLEEICRALGVPLDLIGGQRTFENSDAAQRAMWADTIIPEARMFEAEITEQLLPLFPGEADTVEFDFADVPVLQESEQDTWGIWSDKIVKGAVVINEWRKEHNLKPVAWGDTPWFSATMMPVHNSDLPEPPEPPTIIEQPQDDPLALPAETEPRGRMIRSIAYGSPEHERAWTRAVEQMRPWEETFARATAALLRRQKQAVLARLRNERGRRDAEEVVNNPFDKARWIKTFRTEIRPIYTDIVRAAGTDALTDVIAGMSFDLDDPGIRRVVMQMAQSFAVQVNETTWDQLRQTLIDGFDSGDGLDALAARIEDVMGARLRSSGEAIARTETVKAANQASIAAWRQSGVVSKKRWLAALDERTRDTHVAAHGQEVGLDEDFHVGAASGPGPGNMGSAAESVNCRCVLTAVLDVDV